MGEKRILLILVAIFCAFIAVNSQNVSVNAKKSTVKGTVTDINGAVIPKTKVSLYGKSGRVFSTWTNADGVFQIDVNSDIYQIEFLRFGFTAYRIEDYNVPLKSRMLLDVALSVSVMIDPIPVGKSKKGENKILLTGTVYDPYGAVVPNTKVTARNSKGQIFESVTAEDGIYRIRLPFNEDRSNSVAARRYDIAADRPNGFKRTVIRNVKIISSYDGKMQLDLVLEVSAQKQGRCRGICL